MKNKGFEIFFFAFIFLILISIGLLVQYSVSVNQNLITFKKQLIFLTISAPLSFFFCLVFFEQIKKNIYLIYIIWVFLLIGVFLIGKIAMGARRWVEIAGFNLQPSEIFKIILIFTLAKYFANFRYFNLKKLVYFLIPSLIVIFPSILIFLQPNLGTSIVVFCIGFGVVISFFDNKKFLFSILAIFLIASPLIWNSVLHQYQRQRILTFLNPESDIKGSGYNVNQSKIAIGSGGLFGKGFMLGSQNKLNFLPEQHTDFVFTVFSEEFGFFWNFFLIFVYMILIIKLFYLIEVIKKLENKIILFGITLLFSAHFFINTFMVSGLLPATGVPLSFISYGRSFFLLNLLCMNFIFVIIYRDEK
jgi:rod shape determining protein RodA